MTSTPYRTCFCFHFLKLSITSELDNMLPYEKRYYNMEQVYDRVEERRNIALEQAVENRVLTQLEKQRFINLKLEVKNLAKAESVSWRQKSRCFSSNGQLSQEI